MHLFLHAVFVEILKETQICHRLALPLWATPPGKLGETAGGTGTLGGGSREKG